MYTKKAHCHPNPPKKETMTMEKSRPPEPVRVILSPEEIEQVKKFAMERMVAKREDTSPHELINERPVDKINYNNRIIRQNIVETAEDLESKPGINLNPPPPDGRCHCCGRHISELKPFGKAGDPLVGNFEGALLVKRFRRQGPYDEKSVLAMDEAIKLYEADGYSDPHDWLINKYGETDGKNISLNAQLWDCVESSWECRDCIVLDTDEYFERYAERIETPAQRCECCGQYICDKEFF
jgi:hypothetical protein